MRQNTIHVLMLLANAYKPDPRVRREAAALSEAGYRVSIICWDRLAELPTQETDNNIEIIHVHDVQSAYGSGWRQLWYLPRFWRRAVRLALELQPDVIHCHDLDTLYAGRQIKSRLGCPLIYDAHEHYPALMSLYLPALLVIALTQWERWLMRSVDATITASTILRNEFIDQGIQPVTVLGNYPEIASYAHVEVAEVSALRKHLGIPDDTLLVAYIGGFSRNRVLVPFVDAAALLPDVEFHLWGDGLQRPEVEAAVARHENTTYHGWASPDELPLLFHVADIIFYCLRLDYPGARYNAPNTLSQAMAAGRPLICTGVGDLGQVVGEIACGILIDEATPQSIAEAIQQMQDPDARAKMGSRGVRATQSTYNATAIGAQLIAIYRSLLGQEA